MSNSDALVLLSAEIFRWYDFSQNCGGTILKGPMSREDTGVLWNESWETMVYTLDMITHITTNSFR